MKRRTDETKETRKEEDKREKRRQKGETGKEKRKQKVMRTKEKRSTIYELRSTRGRGGSTSYKVSMLDG